MIYVAHMMLASKAPEFAMTEDEARQESVAICNYLKHTKVKIDPKTEALVTMLVVVAGMEAPRIIAFTRRKAWENKEAARQQQNPNVVPFDTPMGNGGRDPYGMPTSH